MRLPLLVIHLFALMLLANSAFSIQIGPEIRIGAGEATIGGLGVKPGGKLAVPNVDQVLDNYINSTPLTLLSDADKANIKGAAKAVGFVSAVVSDPVTGLVIISILSGDGKQNDIPIPTVETPPTGKSWTFTAKCLVQQEGGLVTAFFDQTPAGLDQIKHGDILDLTANHCPEYREKSVTAVKVKMSGRTDPPGAQPPAYLHYIVGRTV